MELLAPLLQRKVIIGLAVLGAVIAVVGSSALKRGSRLSPRAARFVLRLGYGLTWASIALFIAAGFFGR